jgi:hypothetical protein
MIPSGMSRRFVFQPALEPDGPDAIIRSKWTVTKKLRGLGDL